LYAAAFRSSALLFSMKNLFICCGVRLEHSTITLERALKEDFFSVGWFGFELLLVVTDEGDRAIEAELLLLLVVVNHGRDKAINEFAAP
jgi:hypothetical protein